MDSRRIAAALVAAVCLSLVGCAGGGRSTEGGASMTNGPSPEASASLGSASNPPVPATPVPAKPTPGTPTPFPGETTVRGTVVEGVELGCMILNAEDGHRYLLLGGDRSLISAGKRLQVIGRPQPGLMTTCQEGTPFKVSQVRAI